VDALVIFGATGDLAKRRPQLQELAFSRQPGIDQRPYDRLIAAALDGNPILFARQDAVEAAWKVVDQVLDDVGPVYSYQPGTWDRTRPMHSP
jgi:glucose-6-phosphate 1-dehydrogenase